MRRGHLRTALVVLAFLVVWGALVLPDRFSDLDPGHLLRIPLEGLVLVAVLLVLGRRPGRVVAVVAGLLLGLLTGIKLLNGGFYGTLDRPAHLLTDRPMLGNAFDYVNATRGHRVAVLAVVLAVVLLVGVLAVTVASLLVVARTVRSERVGTVRPLAALAVVWAVAALLGQPLADRSTATFAADEAHQVHADLADRREFARSLRISAPPQQQHELGALRGKNVILVFVESYGRVALEDPEIGPGVGSVLADADRRLTRAGFGARSAFLTSSTAGGGSWFAHSTLLSGLWVDSPSRYDALLDSRRSTLVEDFGDAGWTTTSVMPATRGAWPEGAFYGWDRIATGDRFGYRGPNFGWSPMPDQFALSWVDTHVLRPARGPLFLAVELSSSHHPWAPLPALQPWSQLGDGSEYAAIRSKAIPYEQVWRSDRQIKAAYGRSVQYSLSALFSFLQEYGDRNTVTIFLGDHQPAPVVTGSGAGRDVPIAVVAKDPAVLKQMDSWNWQDGVHPAPGAPVWRMDAFRDRFVSAFSPPPATGSTP